MFNVDASHCVLSMMMPEPAPEQSLEPCTSAAQLLLPAQVDGRFAEVVATAWSELCGEGEHVLAARGVRFAEFEFAKLGRELEQIHIPR